jgi:hypothetical protein
LEKNAVQPAVVEVSKVRKARSRLRETAAHPVAEEGTTREALAGAVVVDYQLAK